MEGVERWQVGECTEEAMWWFFFFSSRRRHTRFDCDWSSDVCSSDLELSIHNEAGVRQCGNRADQLREGRGVIVPVARDQARGPAFLHRPHAIAIELHLEDRKSVV